MLHITLKTDASGLIEKRFLQLFDSKISYLAYALQQFERRCIPATILFSAGKANLTMCTTTAVHCDDIVFRQELQTFLVGYNRK